MVTDKGLLGILQLIRHHVERDGSTLLQDKRGGIDSTVAIVEIGAEITEIVAGSVDQLLDHRILLIAVPRHIQCNNTRRRRRGKRGTVHRSVRTAHLGRIRCTGRDEIYVFTKV